ncbi:peptide synthetase [Micractinium conductrix]|uniref:Peptide synthetase n=1 Tax=Micractinium conductrix TaxID=554055 RepID=A0A2P6V759_9CHLO|nr:peptide synthetase [Micractinium conductrix]|eukprot:PSC69921.1 peptide synthetase [Micractinium conductrix]
MAALACQLRGPVMEGIEHCLDDEPELQELFMGSDLQAPPAVPKTAAPAAAAPAPPPVDTGRIQIQRCSSDGLREALMSS